MQLRNSKQSRTTVELTVEEFVLILALAAFGLGMILYKIQNTL